jgi:hypothetical protein
MQKPRIATNAARNTIAEKTYPATVHPAANDTRLRAKPATAIHWLTRCWSLSSGANTKRWHDGGVRIRQDVWEGSAELLRENKGNGGHLCRRARLRHTSSVGAGEMVARRVTALTRNATTRFKINATTPVLRSFTHCGNDGMICPMV